MQNLDYTDQTTQEDELPSLANIAPGFDPNVVVPDTTSLQQVNDNTAGMGQIATGDNTQNQTSLQPANQASNQTDDQSVNTNPLEVQTEIPSLNSPAQVTPTTSIPLQTAPFAPNIPVSDYGIRTDYVKSLKNININGMVKKMTGDSIPEATIIVRDVKEIMVKVFLTNSAGVFMSTLRAPGTYHIEVRHDGDVFEPITLNLVGTNDYSFEVVSVR